MNTSGGDRLDLSQLSAWAPELAKTFVALSGDIALVIDGEGVIRAVEQGDSGTIAPAAAQWVGQPWIDTVSGDTRGKIQRLLEDATREGVARRREVNHTLQPGVSIPIAYTAIRLGENGPVLAVGRDMRAIAAIQQRFIDSQQDMERGYWHTRQAELREQLLEQVATDAVMAVDPESLSILAANPAAAALFSATGEQLVGRNATSGFAHVSRGAIGELLATARAKGQSGEIRARLLGAVTSPNVSAISFRADDGMRLLVRLRMASPAHGMSIANAGDGPRHAVVVTDSTGRITMSNPAFLDMVRLGSDSDAKGRSLGEWMGDATSPLDAIIDRVRRHGVVGSVATTARVMGGTVRPVGIAAALLTEGDQECIGFTIEAAAAQGTAWRLPVADDMHHGLEALAMQLGDLPLVALVRDAAALAERHFIALALRRVEGDVDAAALLLGIDRARVAGAGSEGAGPSTDPDLPPAAIHARPT